MSSSGGGEFEGLCYRVMGFIEGEGNLTISIAIRSDRVQVFPQLTVVQSVDINMLKAIQEVLKCGKIYLKRGRGRRKDSYVYRVQSVEDIVTKVIPFFDKYGFIGKMKEQYPFWREAALIVYRKRRLTLEDARKIFDLKKKLEEGRPRKMGRGQRVTWERIVKAFAPSNSKVYSLESFF
jgi:hypothetical protein